MRALQHGLSTLLLAGAALLHAAAALAAPAALAATDAAQPAVRVAGFSPQGEVALVRQVQLRFDASVVAAGDPRQAAPVRLLCAGAAPAGSGRWLDDRRWVWDFEQALPPATRCTASLREDWRPLQGRLVGPREFGFRSGGPALLNSLPWEGATVEEEQHFILRLNGPIAAAAVAQRGACEVQGLGERLPLQVLTGPARQAVLASRHLQREAERSLVVHCGRPLPAGVELQLRWDANAQPGRGDAVQRLAFRVRPAFGAEFSCERERAAAPCLPVRPLRLRFSSPVARELAAQVRLQPLGSAAANASSTVSASPSVSTSSTASTAAGAGTSPAVPTSAPAAIAPYFEADDKRSEVEEIVFRPPFAERSRFRLNVPAALRDASGRALANASSFPLTVATAEAPPLAKLAAAPFGVLEAGPQAALPITLRRVQADLQAGAASGQVRVLAVREDAQIIAWIRRLERYHESLITAQEAGRPRAEWETWVEERDAQGRVQRRRVARELDTRALSLLSTQPQARRLSLPTLPAARAGQDETAEVIGLPLPERGYQVVELESQRLGQALLEPAAPMYVRSGVLVTQLAVHFKRGRENALVWVTSLDRGRPVADAEVAVSDCEGHRLWAGRTDASGLARIETPLQVGVECPPGKSLFVSARKTDAQGVPDLAFVFDGWQQGIEPWRFQFPVSDEARLDERAHTVFDRTLLRAGETVSMKHFIRRETSQGLALLPPLELPQQLAIEHEGSGERWTLPLHWPDGRSAVSSWTIPQAARLGAYRVELQWRAPGQDDANATTRAWPAGGFRVEAFRVPLIDARLLPPRESPVAPQALHFGVQLQYGSGGPVAKAPLHGTALLRPRAVHFAGYEDFRFDAPRADEDVEAEGSAAGEEDESAPEGATAPSGRLLVNRVALHTDAQGAARLTVPQDRPLEQASEVHAEIEFTDPNGEVQTAAASVPLWPAAVVPGLRTAGWAARRGQARFTALALSTQGRPLAGQALEVRGVLRRSYATRKRIVGGFYAYVQHREREDLGVLCSGRSDALGRLECQARLEQPGEVQLVVSARDAAGHRAQAASSIWVTRQGAFWFEQDNDDRIDLLPEKRQYEPGETARLQLRMPYRAATVLLSVEREGVLDARVLELRGDDAHIELKIDKAWAPNVYVSALAVRGRVRPVPWQSFFRWGWRAPLQWLRAYRDEGPQWRAPTAMIDLARPSFKLGVAALEVGRAAHRLQVSVQPERSRVGVRETVPVRVQVQQDGRPAAGAELAFAAVDEALLALRENESWDLLDGLLHARPWGVQTASAQGEVIGRRHYGRKAVPAGGGGGHSATRELFDTLLLWQPRVRLDARGQALLQVPVNDALTRFRLVAVADAGADRFGHGSAELVVTQDLQILPGLPSRVRAGDRFQALLTLRNASTRDMRVRATLQAQVEASSSMSSTSTAAPAPASAAPRLIALAPQTLRLPAGQAQELSWPVQVPADASALRWQASAVEVGAADAVGAGTAASAGADRVAAGASPGVSPGASQDARGGGAHTARSARAQDRLQLRQAVDPAVPARVLQAVLRQLDGDFGLPLALPAGARAGRVELALQSSLGGALPGLRRYFESYPYTCLEQRAAKAIGLHDAARWQALVQTLPTYLDEDGLASYFPPRAGAPARGSDRLTAHLLAVAHEAGLALPPELRQRMLDGLLAFVQGRIERRFWSARPDLAVRKLAAIAALARAGQATPALLGSIALTPAQWPTAALIDWLQILRRLPELPQRAQRLEQAQQLLRARLDFAGSTLHFADEAGDDWWWLMDGADANAARLILAVIDEPAWQDDLPRLVAGALARQRHGAWSTTVANTWGVLALQAFARRFEHTPPSGRTQLSLGAAQVTHDWSQAAQGGTLQLPWDAAPALLQAQHQGAGKPWLSVQALASLPLTAPLRAGYGLTRSLRALQRADATRWSRGDIVRVRVEIEAQADRNWVVLADPIPAGATLLGSGLSRDSALATRDERAQGSASVAFDERGDEGFRRYFEFMPRGRHVVEYTLRLNTPGHFLLPPTRVQALYAPDAFGEAPNAPVEIAP